MPFRPSTSMSDYPEGVFKGFTEISGAQQVFTEVPMVEAIRKAYPELYLTISSANDCDYLSFAAAGQAIAVPIDSEDSTTPNLKRRQFYPPARRLDGAVGGLADDVEFGKYLYKWQGTEFILYTARGMREIYLFESVYLLGPSKESTEACTLATCRYMNELHGEVWVFDQGFWQKSRELWQSVEHSSWDDVILEEGIKKSIMGEIDRFFSSREKYASLKVPWKRGIIYYGPPGNGKTISIKATMNALYKRSDPVPTLYVRSLTSFQGPEHSLSQIFIKARQTAPCYLVFEDLDSIVTDAVRSFFLNQVDGLENNDGILMIGSTNHLERLDPGISKRPSRFDRKYLFPEPDLEQRVRYCEYWRKRLSETDDVEFPQRLCKPIADITHDFSFAFMQEAFVAALLIIAAMDDTDVSTDAYDYSFTSVQYVITEDEDKDLDQYVLWREMKKQVRILRQDLEQEK